MQEQIAMDQFNLISLSCFWDLNKCFNNLLRGGHLVGGREVKKDTLI